MAIDNIIYRTKNGTIITPYKKYQCRDLEYSTSIYDKVYHKNKELTGFFVNNYKPGQDAFITHYLSEDYLVSYFRNYTIYEMQQTRALDIDEEFELCNDVTLRDIQGKVANEVISSRNKYNEWFINLQQGIGKTLLGAYLSARLKKKTMIICFMKDILKHWKDTYLTKTTIQSDRIKEINSGKWLEKIYMDGNEDPNHDIYLVSPNLITSYLNNHPWTQFSDVINDLGIGLIIYDEGHRNMSAMVKINSLTNVKYTIYMSGDFAQGDYLKEKMFYRIFQNTKIIKPDEKVIKSLMHTKVIVVDYNSHPSVTESTMIYNKYGFSAEYYMEYQLKKGKLIEVVDEIMKLISKSRKAEYKTLFLLEHIRHVDLIYEHLCKSNNDTSLIIGRYHSKMNNDDKEITLEHANVIISTYKSFGTGMDIEDIKYVVSLNQCNKITANQAAGRSRALPDGSDSIYFMVIDNGFKYCKQKTKKVLEYLAEQKLKEPPFVYHM